MGKLFFRYFLPRWLNRFVQRQQKNYNQHQQYREKNVDKDEKVKFDKNSTEGSINPDVGEYVDFEEVDDKDNETGQST